MESVAYIVNIHHSLPTTCAYWLIMSATGVKSLYRLLFFGGKASLNEGSVAWEIDIAKSSVIRDKRMVGVKDGGTCKTISRAQSGFED